MRYLLIAVLGAILMTGIPGCATQNTDYDYDDYRGGGR